MKGLFCRLALVFALSPAVALGQGGPGNPWGEDCVDEWGDPVACELDDGRGEDPDWNKRNECETNEDCCQVFGRDPHCYPKHLAFKRPCDRHGFSCHEPFGARKGVKKCHEIQAGSLFPHDSFGGMGLILDCPDY